MNKFSWTALRSDPVYGVSKQDDLLLASEFFSFILIVCMKTCFA